MPDHHEEKAWVVFSGHSDIPYLKYLRRGYRHCFLVLRRGHHWVSYDPLSHKTEIELHALPADFDLPQWLRARGYMVVETDLKPVKQCVFPLSLFTCVEAVKRVIGVRDWRVITPWQLYKYLIA